MSILPSNFDQAEYFDIAHTDIPTINAPPRPTSALLTRAILFGIAGAAAGAVLDATFIGITNINIGYLALVIAWLVAKAMVTGSRGEGGRAYQIAACVLTYLSVAAAHSMLIWWFYRKAGKIISLNAYNLFALAKAGVLSPFTRFESVGLGAILGLVILFIGLRAAWRMTSGDPTAVRHPFAR